MSQIKLLYVSSSSASDGSVFQSDGENRQGEEDVISDTLYVTGCYRPEIGECVVVIFVLRVQLWSVQSPSRCSDSFWFTMNFPTEVYIIDLSDLLENDSVCSGHILLNGYTTSLFISFQHIFRKSDGRKTCEKIHCRAKFELEAQKYALHVCA